LSLSTNSPERPPLPIEDAGVVRDVEDQEGQQAIETDDRLAADVRLSKAEEGDKSAIVELPIVSTGARTTEP
jgi:hypothetical protein